MVVNCWQLLSSSCLVGYKVQASLEVSNNVARSSRILGEESSVEHLDSAMLTGPVI